MSWLRQIVPEGYAEANLLLTGTSALLMKSGDVDPDGELFRAYVTLGTKRNKTLDDGANLRKLEWELGLYLDEDLGPYIPSRCVKELLRSAATKYRRGEDIRRSLIVVEYRIPLTYEGPRDQDGLWEQGYRKTMKVANAGLNRGRVDRCRPCFENWSLDVDLAYDPEDLDADFLELVVERSQKFGLCDGRSIGFGAFTAELVHGNRSARPSANGKATKTRDKLEEIAHAAAKTRVLAGRGSAG